MADSLVLSPEHNLQYQLYREKLANLDNQIDALRKLVDTLYGARMRELEKQHQELTGIVHKWAEDMKAEYNGIDLTASTTQVHLSTGKITDRRPKKEASHLRSVVDPIPTEKEENPPADSGEEP